MTAPAPASAPPAVRSIRHPASWPLRAQLVAGILALLVMVVLVIGSVAVVAVRQLMLGQLDAQLVDAAERTRVRVVPMVPGGVDSGPVLGEEGARRAAILEIPGQAAGTIGVLLRGGEVLTAGRLDATGASRSLDPGLVAGLTALPTDAQPRSVALAGGLGEYRAVAVELRFGARLAVALPLDAVQHTTLQLGWIVAAVAGGAIVLAVAGGSALVRRSLRPLGRVAAAATEVAGLSLHEGAVALPTRLAAADTDPATEAGQVGAAFNRMLDHIETSLAARHAGEERLRQFVADASHELRTPLASIRGYAELTRRGRYRLHPDASHALARVESEAVRMGALVDDLLLLARLDAEPVLRLAPLALAPLLRDALADAAAAGQEHRWRFEPAAGADDLVVLGDAARLQQAVANLLANARAHTPEGTSVRLGLAVEADGGAILSVADDGPGIAAELLPTVFERFVRGDASRSRAAGSTGLGLAIVRAVITAHGGAVAVESAPGRTVFTVTLPALPPAPPGPAGGAGA